MSLPAHRRIQCGRTFSTAYDPGEFAGIWRTGRPSLAERFWRFITRR